MRRFVGLSQAQLARLVGASQPAISRLEKGSVAKQVIVVLRVGHALSRALRSVDEALLDDGTRALLRGLELLAQPAPGREQVLTDPELEELVRIYRALPPAHRRGLLSVIRAWQPPSR